MEYHFEYLDQLPQILAKQEKLESLINNQIDKRWFNTKDIAIYLGYSKESINKKVQSGDFELGVHYYKKTGKLLFDKNEVDNWVMGIDSSKTSTTDIVNNIFDDVIKETVAINN